MSVRCLPYGFGRAEDKARTGEVGQLQTCEKAYETGNLANFANSANVIEVDRTVTPDFVARDSSGTEEKIFEQKATKATKFGKSRRERTNLAKLANFKPSKKPMKQGTLRWTPLSRPENGFN